MAHEKSESMLVFFPQHRNVGEIATWPLHMTILPWMNVSSEELISFVERNVRREDVTEITAAGTAVFGNPEKGRPFVSVHLVEPANRLQTFHERFYDKFKHLIIEDRNEYGSNYVPHVTYKEGQEEIKIGDMFLFDEVSVVAWLGGKRSIVSNIPFKS